MRVDHCSRCGEHIASDEIRYIVGVQVTLDLDGFQGGVESAYEIAERLNAKQSCDESLSEVFSREMVFTLCKHCRDGFVDNPLGRQERLLCPDLGFIH
ncbi:MAG: hypothetical protein JW797_18685 [Bradymonadales bacterium]|nr:hypothetical protein [Bradymonadales bacterium]